MYDSVNGKTEEIAEFYDNKLPLPFDTADFFFLFSVTYLSTRVNPKNGNELEDSRSSMVALSVGTEDGDLRSSCLSLQICV